jgi:tripartite ATP-independent transporter DctP family solute receptor
MERFASLVTERSGGAWRIELLADGQLGQERELLTFASSGTLDFVKASATVVERFAPKYHVLNLPFLFRDRAHARAVRSSPVGQEILASTTPKGLIGLTFYEAGSRSFYGRKPINHPDDLKGLRIRIQPSPTMARLVDLLGAQPIQLAWDLTSSALQTGIVDGAENSISALTLGGHGTVARYYSFDEHTTVPDVLLVSACHWSSFTRVEQDLVRDAAVQSQLYMDELWAAFEAAEKRKAEGMGVVFTYPDKQPFVERTRVMRAEAGGQPEIADLIRQIEQA